MYLLYLILLLINIIQLHLRRMELVRPSLLDELGIVVLRVSLRVNGWDAPLALDWWHRTIAIILL
jgi:hypothetical protein